MTTLSEIQRRLRVPITGELDPMTLAALDKVIPDALSRRKNIERTVIAQTMLAQ